MQKFFASGLALALSMSVALPALAKERGGVASSASAASTITAPNSRNAMMIKEKMLQDKFMKQKKEKTDSSAATLDTACMQAAVDKRETAIIAGVDAYSSAVKSALSVRKDALKAAWAITEKAQREAALKAAWFAFRDAGKKTSGAMKDAKNAAWKTFKTDAKACRQSDADSEGQGTDMSL